MLTCPDCDVVDEAFLDGEMLHSGMVCVGRLLNYLEHRLVVAVESHGIVQRKIDHVVELTHVDCLAYSISESNELCLC